MSYVTKRHLGADQNNVRNTSQLCQLCIHRSKRIRSTIVRGSSLWTPGFGETDMSARMPTSAKASPLTEFHRLCSCASVYSRSECTSTLAFWCIWEWFWWWMNGKVTMKRIQNHALHYSRELRGSGIRAEYDCAILRARTSLVCSIAGWYELSLFFFSFFFSLRNSCSSFTKYECDVEFSSPLRRFTALKWSGTWTLILKQVWARSFQCYRIHELGDYATTCYSCTNSMVDKSFILYNSIRCMRKTRYKRVDLGSPSRRNFSHSISFSNK